MPGGICAAAIPDVEFVAAARCGLLGIRVLGIPMQVSLGGFAEARFPERTTEQLQALSVGDRFEVVWERAVFHGRHPLLGPIRARLSADRQHSVAPSFVESESALGEGDFFPATNRNHLVFSIDIPRFGWNLESSEPIVNSAIISQIPPYGSIYDLERPVRFSMSSGLFASVLGVEVEKCSIKLMELAHIKVVLSETGRTADEVSFLAELTNETTEEAIQVSWMVWPDDGGGESVHGVIDLERETRHITLAVPLALLRTQRWFAVAIASPFRTDAAEIARFPVEDHPVG